MIAFLLSPFGRYLLIAIAVCGLVWGYGRHRYNEGRDACQATQEAAIAKQAADLARREREAVGALKPIMDTLTTRADTAEARLAELAKHPIVRVQTREVPIHDGQTSCPVSSLSADFRLRYNEAAAAYNGAVP